MKFDVVVGNPPYQEDNAGNNRNSPIYQNFYNLAEKISSRYCLISPARFLFDAGQTPKDWNQKMLNDEHIKVVYYNQDSSKVFPGPDITGGVAAIYRDSSKVFGAIETFISSDELKSIMNKVVNFSGFKSISSILFVRSSYKFNEVLFKEHPEIEGRVKGSEKRSMGSNVFDRYPEIFFDDSQNAKQIRIYGRQNNSRAYKYVNTKYIQDGGNLYGWKVFVPKSNGSGAIGEVSSTPVIGNPAIGQPNTGHTQTFISIGNFSSEAEAKHLLKYLRGKFSRSMLGVKKITQDNATKEIWSKVPLQDFSPDSDIDWSKPIAEIDQQLYKKYGLSAAEIEFIETKVKAMD